MIDLLFIAGSAFAFGFGWGMIVRRWTAAAAYERHIVSGAWYNKGSDNGYIENSALVNGLDAVARESGWGRAAPIRIEVRL